MGVGQKSVSLVETANENAKRKDYKTLLARALLHKAVGT